MATDEDSRDSQPKKCDLVAILSLVVSAATLVVLALTLKEVRRYAGEAKRQNVLLTKSVGQQEKVVQQEIISNRPVVMSNMALAVVVNKKGEVKRVKPNVLPDEMYLVLINFGKSVALDVFDRGHLIVANPGEVAPVDPECDESKRPIKEDNRTALAPGPNGWPRLWTVLPGNNIAEANAGKVLYAVGCVYYTGLDKNPYYSDICLNWAPNRGANPFRPCEDRNRNYTH